MYTFFYRPLFEYEFIKVTKFLFDHEEFKGMSSNAILLYSALLDRSSLSAKNKWRDSLGRIFVNYTMREACDFLKCSLPTAVKTFKEIEELGLIERKKDKKGGADRIFVKICID